MATNVTPFPVTTDKTLRRDLINSLNLVGVHAGTTWGHFVQAVEGYGVHRDTPLGSIEFGVMQGGSGRIRIEEEDGQIEVRELSQAAVRS